jgi:hypothetical protein
VVIPLSVSVDTHPHPSQGILATTTSGVPCSVYYLYGADQAVALAAHAAGTPFDPRSLDLPSIGALVGFYHACMGFLVKQIWLDTIKAGNCDTFDGITYSNAARYCPDAHKTIMSHLAQQRQNVRLTKPKPTLLVPTRRKREVMMSTLASESNLRYKRKIWSTAGHHLNSTG